MQVGTASWYGPGFHGNRTASGEVYDQHDLTAAHPSLPLGTRVSVTNLANGRQVDVRINDRGPFVKGRSIDLSYAAARSLGMVGPGTAKVRIEVVDGSQATLAPLAYSLQVGSFTDRNSARELQSRLSRQFDDVYISTFDGKDGSYYRVRVGRFAQREAAASKARAISRLGLPVIIVEDRRPR